MQLTLLNFPAVVSNAAAAVQGACSKLLNLTVGSVLRAILEANASVGLWIQYLIVQVWLGTRLATSTGIDVDSFVGDFGMVRLLSVPATGLVTFGRFSTSAASLVTPYFNADGSVNTNGGASVLTADQTLTYGVTIDTTNPNWNVLLNAYLIPVGIASVDLPVQSLTPGSSGNIQAGTISLLATAVAGLDTVTNAAPFQNGQDAETDDALKARFQNYINTRARGTPAAIDYSISTVQPGISFSVVENTDPSGAFRPGFFTVTIDDGTGSPPSSLLTAVTASIDAYRPIGSRFAVQPPKIITVNISMSITVGPNGTKSVLQGTVQNAVLDFIDTLPVGGSMPWSRLAMIAYSADPNITNVTQIVMNGGTADVTANIGQVIKAGSVSIN